jgi:hypothetical protein
MKFFFLEPGVQFFFFFFGKGILEPGNIFLLEFFIFFFFLPGATAP